MSTSVPTCDQLIVDRQSFSAHVYYRKFAKSGYIDLNNISNMVCMTTLACEISITILVMFLLHIIQKRHSFISAIPIPLTIFIRISYLTVTTYKYYVGLAEVGDQLKD